MRLPFNGSYAVNQRFNDPCCRATYAQYGMKGHNGLDFNLPSGTPIVAVRSGSLYRGYEANGYGNYLFLTDSNGDQYVYAHLQNMSNASYINEGEVIGHSDNTGNSSGPHLHFGYRPKNYNPNNGFLGYQDPIPLFNQTSEPKKEEDMPSLLNSDQVGRLFQELLDRPATRDDVSAWVNRPIWDLVAAIVTGNEHDNVLATREKAKELAAKYQAGQSAEFVPVNEQLFRRK